MSAIALRVNPVLDRELRQRLRGRAGWVSLTLYLVVLGLILRLVFGVATRTQTFFGTSQVQAASGAGRSIFHWLLFVMLGLICFIVPGLTAGAIASERERQTLIPLQITLLSPRSIVTGKLLASLAFVVLLVIAGLPFLSVSFLLGGVSAAEVVKGVGMVLVVAVSIASLSLACSSAARRTQTATVTAYALVGILVIGTLIIYGSQRALDTSATGTTPPIALLLNPFAATAEVVRGRGATNPNLSSPFTAFQDMIDTNAFQGVTVDVGGAGPGGGTMVTAVPFPVQAPPPPRILIPAPATTIPGAIPQAAGSGGALVNITGDDVGVARVQAAQAPQPFPGQFSPPDTRPRIARLPFWLASLLSFAILAALALLVAIRNVTAPARGRAA